MGDNLSPAPQLPFRAFLSSKYLQRSSGDKRLTVTGLPVHDNGGGLKLDVFSALMLRSWRCSADSCSMSRIFRKLEMMEVSVVTTACCRRVYR